VTTKHDSLWWWCLRRRRRPRPAELAGPQRVVVAGASVSRLRDCRCVWVVCAH